MSKKNIKRNNRHSLLVCLVVVLSIVAVFLGMVTLILIRAQPKEDAEQASATGVFTNETVMNTDIAPTIEIEDLQDTEGEGEKGLQVTKIGSYTGLFVEDGSDEILSRILMIMVENTGSSAVQYAEIELTDGSDTAYFSLSTLPPGETVVLLEKNRMPYADGKNLTQTMIKNIALFEQDLDLQADKVRIQELDGFLNITNISGQDITGDVVIYYKNASADVLYGGITYRTTMKGGIKADEVKQLTAGHYSANGSRLMFVTIG